MILIGVVILHFFEVMMPRSLVMTVLVSIVLKANEGHVNSKGGHP